jgi:hypothetical protein
MGAAFTVQQDPGSWVGSELNEWQQIGRPAGTIASSSEGVVLTKDVENPPTALKSPAVKFARTDAVRVRLEYVIRNGAAPDPRLAIGWLGARSDNEHAEACSIRVPLEGLVGAVFVADIDLRKSSCWSEEQSLEQIVLNFDAVLVNGGSIELRRVSILPF